MKRATLLLLAGLGLSLSPAWADKQRLQSAPPVYLSECGSCHVPYPGGLLQQSDWRRLLGGLALHFGSDAQLSPGELAAIRHYLDSEAPRDGGRFAGKPGSAAAAPRLTSTAWFERKHLRKLPAAVWSQPAVRSAAQCQACHRQAEQGSYAESEIQVPGYPGQRW